MKILLNIKNRFWGIDRAGIFIFNLVFIMALFFVLGNINDNAVAEVANDVAASNSTSTDKSQFAVVELFTSQGCSSCPPADKVLQKLAADAEAESQPVYVLSFHVDYWDYLGWKDPYGSSAYSDRQRKYARQFGSSRIYTPQMIVNGSREFVGSRKNEAETAVAEALSQQHNTHVNLSVQMKDDTEFLSIQYEVSGKINNALLHLAVVEKSVETNVNRGENSGRKLSHSHVVRAFKTIELFKSDKGLVNIRKPAGLNPKETVVVGYVQHNSTMAIIGANRFHVME